MLALTEDQDAVAVLRACSTDLDRLRREVLNYVDNELANLVAAQGHDAKPTASVTTYEAEMRDQWNTPAHPDAQKPGFVRARMGNLGAGPLLGAASHAGTSA